MYSFHKFPTFHKLLLTKVQYSDSWVLLHGKCKDDERVALERFPYAMVPLCRLGDKSHVGHPCESDEERPSAKQNVARQISAVDLNPHKRTGFMVETP